MAHSRSAVRPLAPTVLLPAAFALVISTLPGAPGQPWLTLLALRVRTTAPPRLEKGRPVTSLFHSICPLTFAGMTSLCYLVGQMKHTIPVLKGKNKLMDLQVKHFTSCIALFIRSRPYCCQCLVLQLQLLEIPCVHLTGSLLSTHSSGHKFSPLHPLLFLCTSYTLCCW